MLENALLRQQLIVLQWQVKRPALTWRDRIEKSAKFVASGRMVLALSASLI
jgi:hypothetical protein